MMRTSEPRDRPQWMLAASVHRTDIDYSAWSSRHGDPRTYPPFWRMSLPPGVADRGMQIWVICAFSPVWQAVPTFGRADERMVQVAPRWPQDLRCLREGNVPEWAQPNRK